MTNLYEQLIGASGTSGSQQKDIASALRRKEDIATIGMLTGNSNITPAAQVINQNVGRQSQQLQMGQRHADQMAYQKSALAQAKEQAELSRQNQLDVANMKFGQANMEKVYTESRDLGKRLRASGDIQIIESMEYMNKVLAKHSGGNIPGSGGLGNTILGLSTEAGREVQQAISAVRNALLKERSGGAVTPAEQERMYREFGTTVFNSDDDLLRGVAMLNARVQADLDAYRGAFPRQGVIEMFEQNFGRPLSLQLDDLTQPQISQGGMDYDSMSDAELDAELARRTGGG